MWRKPLALPTTSVPDQKPPPLRLLLIDFSPPRVEEVLQAAQSMRSIVEVLVSACTPAELDALREPATRFDVILVDCDDHPRWFPRLEQPVLAALFEATVVIGGLDRLPAVQSALLRAGYADVICAQEANPSALISTVVRAHLRQLRSQNAELPDSLLAPIQHALS